jgi:hypothetical protein
MVEELREEIDIELELIETVLPFPLPPIARR